MKLLLNKYKNIYNALINFIILFISKLVKILYKNHY